ncbi:hypothetical protein, partial [Streptococcus pneumoniae]|uniref:hypothetical protein n=1 Tax=Streptococcus pneumoniae TaxID=1313 RepID=UPI001E46E8CD
VYITAAGLFVSRDHPDAVRKAFDSEKEWRRWQVLVEWVKAGLIHSLRLQRRFWLHGPKGTRITSYVCDFSYVRDGAL